MHTATEGQKDAAFVITTGSWTPLLSWWFFVPPIGLGLAVGFRFHKYCVIVEGVEHRLAFGKAVTIPVSAGHHELVFGLRGRADAKLFAPYKYPISVAPGSVQPLRYRLGHFPLAMITSSHHMWMVVKPEMPELNFSPAGHIPHHGYAQQLPLASQQFMAPPSDYDPYAASQPSHEQTRPATPKQTQPTDNGKKRFCTQCGEKNDTGSRFCGGCGQKLMT